MRTHQLTSEEMDQLLTMEQVGRIGTLNDDGSPYVVPVHFVYSDHKIYIHGLSKGQKIGNIARCPQVCFEVDSMSGLLLHDEPCEVNTAYRSVIINGKARLLESETAKEAALRQIVAKYVPSLQGKDFPAKMLKATAVVEVTIENCTGKFYK